jgi:hypothetical protein
MQIYSLLLSCIYIVLVPMRDCHRYRLFFVLGHVGVLYVFTVHIVRFVRVRVYYCTA